MKRFIILFALLFGVCSFNPASAQPPAARVGSSLGWKGESQGQYITALCNDPRGELWVGTEGNGLWRRTQDGHWTQFGSQNGLSDDSVCSLAFDTRHRLWVGTSRGGICVWNGQGWRVFNVLDGPLSERVNAIAISPQNGEVWLGTDAGVARYSDTKGWRYLPHLDGLASNQIKALAFASDGTVFVATACDGVSIAHNADDYATWKNVAGSLVQPLAAHGQGLPSNQINDIAVDSEGNVWAATLFGLARSSDQGQTWTFLRGKDWISNVEGSATGLRPQEDRANDDLLAEDEVIRLAPTPNGRLWLGFARKGYELRTANGELVTSMLDFPADTFQGLDKVQALCPVLNGAIVGVYGGGIQLTSDDTNKGPALPFEARVERGELVPLPAPATPFTPEQLRALTARLSALPDAAPGLHGGFYATDWRTRGDWVGRYGDRGARLYGMGGVPLWHDVSRAPETFVIGPESVGPHTANDAIGPFFYCAELEDTDPRALYTPVMGVRRQAEVNDGSWNDRPYPPAWEGPDLWISFQVPAGTHRAAFYFRNNSGHDGDNKFRDYTLQLKASTPNFADADTVPDLAHARMGDFWNGSYAQFWVQGPGSYRVKIGRGHSHGVVLSALLLDQIRGSQPNDRPMPSMGGVRYVTETIPSPAGDENEALKAARDLWAAAETNTPKSGAIESAWMARLLALRAAASNGATPALLANWRWKLAIWNAEDKRQFDATMQLAFQKEREQQAEDKRKSDLEAQAHKAETDAAKEEVPQEVPAPN